MYIFITSEMDNRSGNPDESSTNHASAEDLMNTLVQPMNIFLIYIYSGYVFPFIQEYKSASSSHFSAHKLVLVGLGSTERERLDSKLCRKLLQFSIDLNVTLPLEAPYPNTTLADMGIENGSDARSYIRKDLDFHWSCFVLEF